MELIGNIELKTSSAAESTFIAQNSNTSFEVNPNTLLQNPSVKETTPPCMETTRPYQEVYNLMFMASMAAEKKVKSFKAAFEISWTQEGKKWMRGTLILKIVELNVDGSSIRNPRVIGCGGILQDCHGKLNFGFAMHLGHGSNPNAVAAGLFYGLRMCLATNFDHSTVNVDSLMLVNIIMA
ncbi:hypothetical protein ACH5RR_013118 [Cinchona calisaya]|uniref:RNase H type-1 domain-containing protein n=1 Tax=Cinchona calisaya TaxID=153742 RepID=A0ABD2ZZ59_9GENT